MKPGATFTYVAQQHSSSVKHIFFERTLPLHPLQSQDYVKTAVYIIPRSSTTNDMAGLLYYQLNPSLSLSLYLSSAPCPVCGCMYRTDVLILVCFKRLQCSLFDRNWIYQVVLCYVLLRAICYVLLRAICHYRRPTNISGEYFERRKRKRTQGLQQNSTYIYILHIKYFTENIISAYCTRAKVMYVVFFSLLPFSIYIWTEERTVKKNKIACIVCVRSIINELACPLFFSCSFLFNLPMLTNHIFTKQKQRYSIYYRVLFTEKNLARNNVLYNTSCCVLKNNNKQKYLDSSWCIWYCRVYLLVVF